ncbi:Peptidase C19 ubiquitin carboxyl-terminal hydrolase 2 [Penicillium vulpinum]|uniref:USP domain-containing protein n=1 Tax=Penicillium vulpinum TaxID=29845 RepID=A0A1V6R8L4_9EURO|nr:Peptidase C19 ubiquitin carboxyl-terminal hydrolase 2 [Penicillium vulpinum]KAJ5959044.1 Peptidase C19 ubiquitin carboxyl-terminal hydrolase 2 [Penicillium vulpinum]OQD97904.1 hypothetical protein PENVUL_c076G05440 [Penicillium vulpinum]
MAGGDNPETEHQEDVEHEEEVEHEAHVEHEEEQVEEQQEAASDKEVKDSTEPREKTANESRTVRTTIPKYWHPDLPDRPTVGFGNRDVDCYRNVTFHLILNVPVFYNWLIWYKEHHAPKGHICNLGSSDEGDPMKCLVCELAEIAQGYWSGKIGSWMDNFVSLGDTLLHSWKPGGTSVEQDPAEYLEVLYNTIRDRTKLMMQGDLKDIFEVKIIEVTRCDGKSPCEPAYNPRNQLLMMISLSGEEGDVLPEKPTLSDIIQRHFDHEDDYDACTTCGGMRTSKEQIGSFPELLLVQLNRADTKGKKIRTHVYLSEELDIETRFIDERWGNKRKIIQYKLTSVILHSGDPTHGHYCIGVKGKGDKWYLLNDEHKIQKWQPEGPGSDPIHLSTCYIFAYRRLPTGDEVPTPDYDAMQIDSGSVFDKNLFPGFDFDSGSLKPVSELDPNAWGNAKELGKFLNMMIPKVVDVYIARSENARHKEFKGWIDEWEKKKGVKGVETSAIGPDIADIVNWTKERGRLEITLTGDGGKGSKLLDLEVQGMHYNRLKGKKRAREEDEGDKEKEKGKGKGKGMFSNLKKKVRDKAKEFENGNGKAKKTKNGKKAKN